MLDAKNYVGKMLAERYRLVRVIGHGASSLVFYAEDLMVSREDGSPMPVAIKLLDQDAGKSKMNAKSFRTELQAVANIPTNPHIVSVKDASFYEDEHFIVMEYVDGKTLRDYLKQKNGPLSPKEIVSVSLQLLQALRLAHGAGVVHRDIKPENILVERADSVGKRVGIPGGADMPFVKLADFGIALLPDDDLFTLKGKGVGTVHYISPEQAGGGRADARSDIYSLGVLMHVMATGRVPFDAQSLTGIITKHQTEMPRHVRGLNPEIPMVLDEIIFTAMQKNPALRYRDALAMEKALKEALRVLEGEGAGVDGDGVFRGLGASSIGIDEIAPKPAVKIPKAPKAKKPQKPSSPFKAPKAPKPKTGKSLKSFFAGLFAKVNKKVLAIGGGCVALVALVVVCVVLLSSPPKPQTYDITVPTLAGTVYTEDAVYPDGIVVYKEKVQYAYSDEVEAGRIISQVPAQGTVVKDVTELEIVLTVSRGAEMVDFELPAVYRTDYKKAKDFIQKIYKNIKVDANPVIAETCVPGVKSGTVIGAYRVETDSELDLNAGTVYKTKTETIKLIVQPEEPKVMETFVFDLVDLMNSTAAEEKIRETIPYLVVVGELNSDKILLYPGVVVGIRLSDGTVVSTYNESTQTLTVTVEKDKPDTIYLLLSVTE